MEKSPADLWRKVRSRYILLGNMCENCGARYFPPRLVCRNCGRNSKMKDLRFKGTGEIYSYTIIRSPPDGFEDLAPYTVALIKLDEGPIVEGHIVDNGKPVQIGTRVRAVLRRIYKEGDEGLIYYQYKFEPV